MGFFWTGQYCVLEFHLLVYFFAGQQERFFFTGMVGIVGDEDGISCPWLKGWISRRWRIPSCACRSRQFHSSLFSAGHRRSLCGTSNQINNRSKCHSKLLLRLKSFVLSVDPDAFLCRIHIEGFPTMHWQRLADILRLPHSMCYSHWEQSKLTKRRKSFS